MDTTKENLKPNPREDANPFSVLIFAYTFGMFKKGFSRPLEARDLYRPIKSDKSMNLGDRLERKWTRHMESIKGTRKKPSLLKVLCQTFWPEYLYLGALLFVQEIFIRIGQPLMLGKMLEHFRPGSTVTRDEALWFAGGIIVLNGLSVLIYNQYVMGCFHYGMKIRAACCALVYRKSLRMSKSALAETASGKIVNLISNDVSRFDLVSILIHYMWIAPLSAVIVTYFLYQEAGWPGMIGILPMVLVVPIQSFTGRLAAIYRKQIASRTDERVRLMDEILSGIQVIKMYAWEAPFSKIIKLARNAELKVVIKGSYVRGLYMTFNLFTTRAALYCALLAMALTDEAITASKVFVFMSFFNNLAQSMSSMFVRGVSEVAEALVATTRLQGFMTNEEFVEIQSAATQASDKEPVVLQNISAKWDLEHPEETLSDIDITLQSRQLLAIIGPVGSGKSSFLQTILGELRLTSGKIAVNGTLSYASQEPWVFGATVRQNILFGQEFNRKRYNEVVHVCALESDFKQFPDGDMSVVGDRGASLSGGQKARINLARAVYREADIYLLDDPLSAVDVHVARHLYEKCVNGFLSNKTRVLVTHQVYYLKDAPRIIILRNGQIEDSGTYIQLAEGKSEYAKLLAEEPEAAQDDEEQTSKENELQKQISITTTTTLSEDEDNPEAPLREKVEQTKVDEEQVYGKVTGSLFLKYLSSGSNFLFVWFVIFLYILAQTLASGADYFVSFWTNIEEFRNKTQMTNGFSNNDSPENVLKTKREATWTRNLCIHFYSGLIIALFIIALARSMIFYVLTNMCSKKLHANLFNKVINATMRFFNTNSSGRILNRFSKDMGVVDEILPKAILDAGQSILTLIGALVLVGVVSPYFLILVGFISCMFLVVRMIFLRSSIALKKLEGMMRSPVFQHLNATLQGLTTIRAFQAQSILRDDFDKHQDYHSSAWFMYIAASSAFAFYLDFLVFIMITIVTFSFIGYGEQLGLKGGQIGLAITQCAALTGLIQWGMRQSADVSNQLTSVERILEYDMVPQEKEPEKPILPSNQWPEYGRIVFKNMGLRYDEEGDLVIRNFSVAIEPSEKVGIVGRTGAGKSSLISALFRLAFIEGDIEIDGVNTRDLQLRLLRTKISIIPQDPVLFSGTLRYNLDPFDEYSDEVLYKALEDVELKDPNNVFNRLENQVMDHGSNYSVGQRQLICLARAIVRKNRILMLDEATANVDPQTDALIQKTIRVKFADCTVLTVAHRLNTIMDSDRVMVMDKGQLLEIDSPHVLLENPNSKFCGMVAETGHAAEEQLRKIAREHYEASNSSKL